MVGGWLTVCVITVAMFANSGMQQPGSSAWLNARVANATRAPLAILLTGCAVFVVALVALIVIPRQARRGQRQPVVQENRPDTAALLARTRRLGIRVDSIDVVLAAATDSLAAARAATRDTLPPELRVRRDSLAATLTTLNRLLARVENAPLPASYRALAQAPLLRDNARANALVDTLAAVEREREDFGASGGVDPIFVALTERAATIGRAITELAERERNRIRDELSALRQLQPRRDTLPASIFAAITAARRDSIRMELDSANYVLAAARRAHTESDAAAERRRKAANTTAPPVAMLFAAALLGLVAGFGIILLREIRHPRISNIEEAERTSGVRVLTVVRPTLPQVDLALQDRVLPPLIDVNADGYRRLYLHLTGARATLAMVTVTGEDAAIAGVVATNIAVSAGHEGRGTLIVDADPTRSPVAAILGATDTPGLADIANGDATWPEALQAITVARDLHVDVIASGRAETKGGPGDVSDQGADRVRRDLARMARRYDVMVLNAPLAHVLRGSRSVLPAPDLLLCVRLGHTRLTSLAETIRSLRAAGTRVSGLVLWNADDPQLPAVSRRTERQRRREAASPAVATT